MRIYDGRAPRPMMASAPFRIHSCSIFYKTLRTHIPAPPEGGCSTTHYANIHSVKSHFVSFTFNDAKVVILTQISKFLTISSHLYFSADTDSPLKDNARQFSHISSKSSEYPSESLRKLFGFFGCKSGAHDAPRAIPPISR